MEMWLLHRRCQGYGTRPSEELRLENPLLAYQFNRVIDIYGTRVNNLLERKKTTGKGKKAKTVNEFTLEEALEHAAFGKERTRKTSGALMVSAMLMQNPRARITI